MNPFERLMLRAVEKAAEWEGACSPNPPVGAIALDKNGKILEIAAHERAGSAHAEAKVLEACKKDEVHTLIVTLEPCNHQGRTPACVDKILEWGVKRVVVGIRDPNPHVVGGGVERLRRAGVEVIEPVLYERSLKLIEGFWVRCRLARPMFIVKTAWSRSGSMIPPLGQKTFTSAESLKLAHGLRKSSDAILTGSGTVLADRPFFTVRDIEDHMGKKRDLLVMDRRHRVPKEWIERQESLGFQVFQLSSYDEILKLAAERAYLKILVEAGPSLSSDLLKSDLWDLHIKITQGDTDKVEFIYRKPLESL